MASKDRISISLLSVKAEAEGLKGIVALLLLAALLFIARLTGLI
jgi:hypothetical protein